MATLFISDRWPYPLAEFRHGTAIRMRLLLRAAQQLDQDIDLLLYCPTQVPLGANKASIEDQLRDEFWSLWQVKIRRIYIAAQQVLEISSNSLWQAYLRPAISLRYQPNYAGVWGSSALESFRDALATSKPNLLFVHRLPSMGPVLRHAGPLPPIAFDLDDVEHKAFKRLNEQPPHWGAKRLFSLWLPAIVSGERRAVRKAACTFVCSAGDASELNLLFGSTRVQSIPNAMPLPPVSALPGARTLLFLGKYGYEPNIRAAEHLISNIWPLVLEKHPDARLLVAGKGCEQIAGFNSAPAGVEFCGFVDDLDALYAKTQVVACPILSGSGTRIKIIEAALRARPVVSTTIGAEGLELCGESEEIILSDAVEDFAAAICRLFDNPVFSAKVARAGYKKARLHYGEAEVLNKLTAQLRGLL